jgi:acetyl-CoA carboxylase biotin carboxyl carrier protein
MARNFDCRHSCITKFMKEKTPFFRNNSISRQRWVSMKNTENSSVVENGLKEQVNDLYEIMRGEKLEELEIKQEDYYIYLKRKGKNIPVLAAQQMVVPMNPVSGMIQPGTEEVVEQETIAGETIKSPIMGMFYRAPSPSLPPFIKEGDIVDTGKTLCIVEAMKVMNEIKAEYRIKIIKILIENGKPINAGQDLFLVEKA